MSAAAAADREDELRQAMALRADGRASEALALLARLEADHPRFSRLHQERGHCHVVCGDAPAAIAALSTAVRLNPALPASWDMLAQLYNLTGDALAAATAARSREALVRLPREVVAASCLVADEDLRPAAALIDAYLARVPADAGALRLAARIRLQEGMFAEAERLLTAALAHAPDFHEARLDYAMALLQQGQHQRARDEAEMLLRVDPASRAYLKQYAAACVGMGDHAAVIDIYARLLDDADPAEAVELRVWRANALRVVGRTEEAIAEYRAVLAAAPDHAIAWFGLANLKTYRFDQHDLAAMQAVVDRTATPANDRVFLHFALGKALEDQGEFRRSWQQYEAGNALRRASARFRPEAADACARRLRQVLDQIFFDERRGWGAQDAAPIFVLGMPRAGSTLVEQILASHPSIEGTRELVEMGRIATDLCGTDPGCGLPGGPGAMLRLTAADARALGERFLAETRAYRRTGRPFFVDKMPDNFWHVGLIHLLLPQATIIDVRRAPMACGFSNLKQLFGTEHHEWSYGMAGIAGQYRRYLALMRHWDRALPGRVLRVHYEDLVADLEGGIRAMLAHCGLPFAPACLAFHANRRSVRTPSAEQVRRPINRDGLDQWRQFAVWLGPLERALGDALTTYRD